MSAHLLIKAPHASQPPLLTPVDRQVFLQEATDLFLHNRQGHLIHRCYLTPEALVYGGRFSSVPDFYAKWAEVGVIPIAGRAINAKYGHPHGFIGIENGVGMESAMRSKSGPFFRELHGLHTWVGRDLSPASINIMPGIMRGELPNVRIIPDMSDFVEAAYPKGLGRGRKIIAEFGLCSGNMEGFPEDGFPYHVIKHNLSRHRSRMNAGDIYTFTFDCNQNGSEVEKAYNNEWTTLWGRELLWAMEQELPIEGDFDPDSYDFRDIWESASHGGFNYMIAQRRMEFAINGIDITIEKGEGWGITNSYKMPIDVVEQLAQDTGFNVDWHFGPDRRVPMPALIAA